MHLKTDFTYYIVISLSIWDLDVFFFNWRLDFVVNLFLGAMQTTFCRRGGGITSTNEGVGVGQRARSECTWVVFWSDARNTQSVVKVFSWRSPSSWCYEVIGHLSKMFMNSGIIWVWVDVLPFIKYFFYNNLTFFPWETYTLDLCSSSLLFVLKIALIDIHIFE